ncbi:vanin-like protein 1 [Aedes albopictus]|uniref:CN hydrolase domain-containing protein n=1 Tax=Aedes albopictus TaxID=7160 RepID=A0ABM1YLE2_AEDAL
MSISRSVTLRTATQGATMSLKYLSIVLVLQLFVSYSSQQSLPTDDSYVVGVVEFRPEPKDMDIATRTSIHLEAYKELIRSNEAKLTDIVVFPELTLNSPNDPVPVPDPKDAIIPCIPNGTELLSQLSCLAIETGKYMVINLSESFECDSLPANDPRPCDPNATNRYNTNVVFDRNGTVIARYRKTHLFQEPGTSVTFEPEIITFDTDFGVRFGVVTCFDLLFAEPTLQLVKMGVKDFVLPAYWESEPPFLTAVQIFESWAYGNDVNLMAAGTNYNPSGSTGTGVFNGRNGAVFSFYTGEATRKIFPVRVPKLRSNDASTSTPIENNSGTVSGRFGGDSLTQVRMGTDFPGRFTTVLINPDQKLKVFNQTICNGKFCCDFQINYEVHPRKPIYHFYRLMAFDGVRTFQGFADAHVSICGVMTCLDGSLASCGLPNHCNSNYLTFNNLTVRGDFIANSSLVMPSTLDNKFHSLDAKDYQFYSTVDYPNDRQRVSLTLSRAMSNLQTFGIYAFNHKNFDYFIPDAAPPPEDINMA